MNRVVIFLLVVFLGQGYLKYTYVCVFIFIYVVYPHPPLPPPLPPLPPPLNPSKAFSLSLLTTLPLLFYIYSTFYILGHYRKRVLEVFSCAQATSHSRIRTFSNIFIKNIIQFISFAEDVKWSSRMGLMEDADDNGKDYTGTDFKLFGLTCTMYYTHDTRRNNQMRNSVVNFIWLLYSYTKIT